MSEGLPPPTEFEAEVVEQTVINPLADDMEEEESDHEASYVGDNGTIQDIHRRVSEAAALSGTITAAISGVTAALSSVGATNSKQDFTDFSGELKGYVELLPGEEDNVSRDTDSGILYITNFQIIYIGTVKPKKTDPTVTEVVRPPVPATSPPSTLTPITTTKRSLSSNDPPRPPSIPSTAKPPPRPERADDAMKPVFIHVPLAATYRVEKMGRRTSGDDSAYCLALWCKDLRQRLKFGFVRQTRARKRVYSMLTKFIFPGSQKLLFAFYYTPNIKPDMNGWSLYDPVKEYQRMGLPSYHWRLCHLNKNYELTKSYPHVFAVPAKADDELVKKSAEFRSSCRVPVLSFKNLFNMATICRSSQPMVGVTRSRSTEDEQLLDLVRECNPLHDTLVILDARPRVNAYANAAKGAGFESSQMYINCVLEFQGIDNIHVMREAIHKLRDLCHSSLNKPTGDPRWLSNLDGTHWLNHVRTVLQGVANVVELVGKKGVSVLLHCSDGWDRTPQMSSLSMLLIDPYYRTIDGFAVLIEKEWCSFGHKFASRLGHARDKYPDTQLSPIFVQFIDCVWQVSTQYPNSFEFNEELLVDLADTIFSCKYGTFLFNCERERVEAGVKSKTVSFWTHVLSRRLTYTSRKYHPDQDPQDGVLVPSYSTQDVSLWSGYYMRWGSYGGLVSDTKDQGDGGVERELTMELDRVLLERAELESQLKQSKKEITALKSEIVDLRTQANRVDEMEEEVNMLRHEIAMLKTEDPLGSNK